MDSRDCRTFLRPYLDQTSNDRRTLCRPPASRAYSTRRPVIYEASSDNLIRAKQFAIVGNPRLRGLILRCNGIDGTRSKVSEGSSEVTIMASVAGISSGKLGGT